MANEPNKELEDLQRILADLKAGPASAPPVPDPPKKRKASGRAAGLLDLIAVAAAVYTLMIATPVGGLVVRAVHWAVGRQVHTKPLVAYFKTEAGQGVDAEAVGAIAQAPASSASTTPAAKKAGIAPNVARALGLILSGGQRVGGHFDVKLPPAAASSFAAIGATSPAATAPAAQREAALLAAVGKLQSDLSSIEGAVAAVAVELPRVRYALRRARAAGVEDPHRYEAFRRFLPPDDRAEADPVVHGTFALATAFGMRWPVSETARVSSSFGWRRHPVLRRRRKHTGVDLAVPRGTPIRAIADGEVLYAARDGVNGRFVKLDHGHGLTSTYCHASQIDVKRGQAVTRGTRVAKSGASGRVSGPHLHFQMELDGTPVDPEVFFRPGSSAASGSGSSARR